MAVIATRNRMSHNLPLGDKPTHRPSSRQNTNAYATRKQVAFGIGGYQASLESRDKTKNLVWATRLIVILIATRTKAKTINLLLRHLLLHRHRRRHHPSRHHHPNRHRLLRLLRPHPRRHHRLLPIHLLRQRHLSS